jgi:hypothetical protein
MRTGGPSLPDSSFKYLFNATFDEIKLRYLRLGIVPKTTLNRVRITTNKGRITSTATACLDGDSTPLFDVSSRGIQYPRPPEDSGSDVDPNDEEREQPPAMDEWMTLLYKQFLVDVLLKSPNPKGATGASYCLLSKEERLAADETLYQKEDLSEVFRSCHYKIRTNEDFDRIFDHIFPPSQHKASSKAQNYGQCKYYLRWKEYTASATEEEVLVLRKELKKRISLLFWIPFAEQDRMWNTKGGSGFIRLPSGSQAAPRVCVRSSPRWSQSEHDQMLVDEV